MASRPATLQLLLLLLTCSGICVAQDSADSLLRNFKTPPALAKPHVYWYWMNGNITHDGIKQDLEWMHRVGIGGLISFDQSGRTPKIVDQRLGFMTPSWNEALRYAVTLADRLGLEFGIGSAPSGNSEAAGPWVRPENSMKKLVWSEVRIDGRRTFDGKLPQPPGTVGLFQNAPANWGMARFFPPAEPIPELYRDVAVIAYRLPANDRPLAELNPVVTGNAATLDAEALWDGDFTSMVSLPFGEQGKPAWIELDFGRPRTVQSMSLALEGELGWVALLDPLRVAAELQASRDGVDFHTIATVRDTDNIQQTVTFAPMTARYFRLLLPAPPAVGDLLKTLWYQKEHRIAEFVLHTVPRVDGFEKKAGFARFFVDSGEGTRPTPRVSSKDAIHKSDVLDLSSRLRADGLLQWTPPPGRWAVLRIGYSLLGKKSLTASPEAVGLETDKLSRSVGKSYMDDYLGRYEAILGPSLIGKRGLRALETESWEIGAQNWTDALPSEFARRRGYDLSVWLPALTGRIIQSAEATEQFLWDFRRTLGELLIENHYGQISAAVHERGMIHYGEAQELRRVAIGDGMDVKRDTDIPMGAMWTNGPVTQPQEQFDADLRESASVAHIYGQNLVAAEAMTTVGEPGAEYAFAPEHLKPTVDRALAAGVNRLIVLASTHQPLNRPGPGFTMGPFGQWFTRHETWAEQAGPWVTYLARSSYLLQQGQFVADVIYYYGQDSNITALYGKRLPPVPQGYAFDFASAHALTKLSVRDGILVTDSGMRYRVLALDPRSRLMSLDVLKLIARLAADGATVVGDKPQATPSLADDATEFHTLADALWGAGAAGEHRYGKGRILTGQSLADAIAALGLEPDFIYSKPAADTTVWFVHRRLKDGDLYFINNRQARAERIEAQFRIAGKVPELWRADTGVVEPVSYRIEGDRTIVPLKLDAHDAVFVVFRQPTNVQRVVIPEPAVEMLTTVEGAWNLSFPPERGAPANARFDRLQSWTDSADDGVKYFSGVATYSKAVLVRREWLKAGSRVQLDLGSVKNVAEVLINGRPMGVLWKAPFKLDVTDALKAGDNRIEIKVSNLWPNRLIGDKQPGARQIAFATFDPFKADSPLLPSGLLGPVTLFRNVER